MASILELLLALNRGDLPGLPKPAPSAPVPYAPVPNLGPLSDDTNAAFAAQNPEPLPPRLAEPAAPDMNFVNQYAGAAPVAPVERNVGTLEKIAAILGGVGAGIQGRGLEFAQGLREQREAPMRRYERERERYEGRRTQGIELADRRAEREAAQANKLAEAQYERDYNLWLKKQGIRQNEADTRSRQAFELLKIREQERIADERQATRDKAQQERDARLIARDFGKVGAKPEIAHQLGRYYSGLTDKISPEAAQFESAQARLTEVRLRRAQNGGTGGGISAQTAKLVEEFNNARQNLVTATARGDAKGQKDLRLRLSQLVKRLAGRPGVEAGYGAGQWPYVKVNGVLSTGEQGQQQAAQPQAKTITRAEMQALGVTDAEAAAEGFTVVP